MSALQCCELLAKSQVFQKQASTSAEESKNRAKKKSHGIDHAGGGIPFRPWTATSHPVEIKGGQNFGERQPSIDLLAENNVRQGFIEPADLEKVVSALPYHLREFTRFAYITGWRVGEIRGLEWSKVNRESKTIFLGRSKNGEPRILPLVGELDKIIDRRWQARTIATREGSTRLSGYVFHCGDGRPIGDFRKAWGSACTKAAMTGLLFHDLRRSAVRNLDRNGVSQVIGMMISGHKTASVYKRYRIVPENDIREALAKVQEAIERERKNTRVVSVVSTRQK
jgi:integrase